MSFTVVFEGDASDAPSNPFKVHSLFGPVQAIARGDLIDERDQFRAALEHISELGDVRADEASSIARRVLELIDGENTQGNGNPVTEQKSG